MRIVAPMPQESGPRIPIPRKPDFLEKRKKSSKTQKLKNVQKDAKISNTPFDQRSLIHREAWFLPCFVRQNQQKKLFFARQFQTTSKQKRFKCQTTSFHNFSPRILNLTSGSGGKKMFKRYLKSEQTDKQTDKHTDRHTDRRTNQVLESIGPEGRCFENHGLTNPSQVARNNQHHKAIPLVFGLYLQTFFYALQPNSNTDQFILELVLNSNNIRVINCHINIFAFKH